MSRHPRTERPAAPTWAKPDLDFFDLVQENDGLSEKTRKLRRDDAGWFASTIEGVKDWADVTQDHLRAFLVMLRREGYAEGYRNHVGRNLQAYFKWRAIEYKVPNLFDETLKVPPAPKLGSNPPPIVETDDMRRLLADAEADKTFAGIRDTAILRIFRSSGVRLAELAGLQLARPDGASDINQHTKELRVLGKGGKVRIVRYDKKAALALARYLIARAKHKDADDPALWLGTRGAGALRSGGVYRAVKRRGARVGLAIYPHIMRHTMSHYWLLAGGQEGDLMALNGWESAQMLKVYGASARSARARTAYDRVDVMGGV